MLARHSSRLGTSADPLALAVTDDSGRPRLPGFDLPSPAEDNVTSPEPSLQGSESLRGGDKFPGTPKVVGQYLQHKRVTGKDLEEWTERLQSDIVNSKLECVKVAEDQIEKLHAWLQKLDKRVEQLSEETDENVNRIGEETTVMMEGCNTRLDQEVKRITFQFDEQFSKERESYQALDMMRGVKMMAIEKRVTDKLKQFSEPTLKRLSELETRVGETIDSFESKLESAAAALRDEISSKFREATETAARELAGAIRDFKERDTARDLHTQELEGRFSRDIEMLDVKVENTAAESRNLYKEGKTEVVAKLTKELDHHDSRICNLEDDVKLLDLSVSAAANVPTRRIEWCIRDVPAKVAAAEGGRSVPPFTWASPDFDIGGANDLRLELKHLSRCTGKLDKGDAIVSLWGPKGLFLIFRLITGESSAQFEHSFREDEPFTSDRLCFLAEQVSPDDDSFRIGIEVLEAMYQVTDTRSIRRAPRGEGGEGQDLSHEAEMYVNRYLNHRVLELVQDRVDTLHSRMVRRIEWRIGHASSLRRYFAEGESLCSSPFDAAGLHDLQFVFYPLGFLGAREGYCSFFLYCPQGTLLKCWLSVGKVRKEVRMSSDQQGYLGRTNFCRFDVEADDSLTLSLEIVEAQRSDSETLVHQVPADWSPRSPNSPKPGPAPQRPEVSVPDGGPAQLAPAISSVLRSQRTPAGRMLEDVRLLPSIWTPTPKGNISDALEGFHAFSAIKSVQRPVSSRRSASAGNMEGGLMTPRTPRPSAARRYDMYAK